MGAGASEDGECRIRYHDLVFEPDMLTAVRDDGAVLQLSRRERAVVRALAQRPHRLLTRDQLLAAMAPHDAELPDRKVDITINRLRRKLNDPARAPRFIATQYGEGYVWIAEALPQPAIAALLVIGPVRSADAVGPAAQALLERLRQAILAHTAAGHTVLLRPEWRPDGPGAACRFSLEASFLAQASGPTAALVLREEPSRHVVLSLRMAASAQPDLSRLAAELVGAIWRRVALGAPGAATPTDVPLPLRMQAAAVLLGPPNDPWEENERRAALARGEDPADPAAALMWAMTRYARLMFPPDWAAADLEGYGAVQEEIEGLVFASLQAARGDPILSVAAAQLLLWTGRGHMDLAEELAQAALSSTTAFAAALPVLGQVRGYRGDTDVALRLFDEARALAEPGSEFEVYLLVLRCRMLLARGDAEALRAQLAELDRIKPATRAQLALPTVLAGDGGLSREAREQLAALDPEAARTVLVFQFAMVARYFTEQAHVGNVMRGLLHHLTARFGAEVVPEAIERALGPASPSETGAAVC